AATTVGASTSAAWVGAAVLVAAVGLPLYLNSWTSFAGSGTEAVTNDAALVASDLDNAGKNAAGVNRTTSIGPALLRLVEEDGSPTVGLLAVLLLENGETLAAQADADGRLFFPTKAAKGTVFVARAGSFLHVEGLRFEGEEVLLRLPAGSSLVGRVVDSDGAPQAGLVLDLYSDRLIWEGREFPDGVERALGDPHKIRTTTSLDGEFYFRGLPADWSGELGLPTSVVLSGLNRREQQGDAMHVEGVRTDLVVEVELVPVLSGIVNDPGSGPLADAIVRVWVDDHDKPLHGSTNRDGRFDIPLVGRITSGLRLEAEAGDGGGITRLELAVQDLPGDHDIGQIELRRGRRQQFLVVDQAGIPISGAVAQQVGALSANTATDGEGRGVVELLKEGEPVLLVDAAGFLTSRHEIGSGWAKVVLEPAAHLALRVLDSGGEPLPDLLIKAHATERLFAEGAAYKPGELDQVAMAGRSHEGLLENAFGSFYLSEDGLLDLFGVAAARPIRVEVYDRLSQLIATHEVMPLSTGEMRPVDVIVPDALRSLQARVGDSAGELLVGATVSISAQKRKGGDTQDTGADGLAHFKGLGADRVRVEVSMRGFATQVHADYVLPPPGRVADFSLERGLSLEIVVQDTAGQLVAGGRLSARGTEQVSVRGLPLFGAEQKLEDLGAGAQRIKLYLGGMLYEQSVDAADGRVVFLVPLQGLLAVSWKLPQSDGSSAYRITVQPVGEDGKLLERRQGRKDDGTGRNRSVHTISGATSSEGSTELVLTPGDWIVVLESSVAKPAKGPWTEIGEPVRVKVELGRVPRVQLGELR
ncbi:MAG: hypothetical protein ACI9HE_003963, partial [Planctomycetota bacterium]